MASRATTRAAPAPGRPRAAARRKSPAYLNFLITLVVVVAVLYLAKPVIVPLALAVLLTFILTPLVSAVQRRGLGRVPSVLLVVSLAFLIAGAVGWVVGLEVRNLAVELPKHAAEIGAKIDRVRGSGTGPMSRLVVMVRHIGQPTADGRVDGTAPAAGAAADKQVVVTRLEAPGPAEQLTAAAAMLLEPAANAALVLVLVIFMLIKREDLRNRIIGLLGHGRLAGTTRVIVDSAKRLSRFLLMQLCINTGFGICFGLALLLVGVPYWFLWGFLAVLLRFIPFIGSWVAALLPIVLSFAIAPGLGQPLLVLAVFVVLELLTANVAEPVLFGHSTGVSPVALLVAAAFWAWVWGPIGLVLSTPLTVCMVVLGQHVPRLKFLSLLLGDQPALAPGANYYQRLLAGDAPEAALVAGDYAAAKGADHVPDDVLVPALSMARRDREHAGLSAEDEAFIYGTTEEILGQLAATSAASAATTATKATAATAAGTAAAGTLAEGDAVGGEAASPAAESVGALLLGCPSHHRAEEIVLRMLAGPAKPAGCRVEVVPTRTLPVEIEARIEREKPALVVVAVMPPGGVVQARYLCRRLRRRFADLRIIVCYLGRVRDFDRLLVRLRAAGASYVTTSLLQSRSQIQALLPAAPATGSTSATQAAPAAPRTAEVSAHSSEVSLPLGATVSGTGATP